MQDWLIFLLGLVLAIPLSIFGNVLTRKYDEIMEKRAISVRGKKMNALMKEYRHIKFLLSDHSRMISFVLMWIMSGFVSLVLIVFLFWVSSIMIIAMFSRGENTSLLARILAIALVYLLVPLIYISYRQLNKRWSYLVKANFFDMYKEKVIEQIIKLGGNPEDLDKEETPGE